MPMAAVRVAMMTSETMGSRRMRRRPCRRSSKRLAKKVRLWMDSVVSPVTDSGRRAREVVSLKANWGAGVVLDEVVLDEVVLDEVVFTEERSTVGSRWPS